MQVELLEKEGVVFNSTAKLIWKNTEFNLTGEYYGIFV